MSTDFRKQKSVSYITTKYNKNSISRLIFWFLVKLMYQLKKRLDN